MMDEQYLRQAFVNAHNAGDTNAAGILANKIKSLQGSGPKEKQVTQRGMILPISTYDDGSVGFDSDSGIVGGIKRAVTLPGQVMRGEVDPRSEEGFKRAFEMAGVVTPALAGARALTQSSLQPHLMRKARNKAWEGAGVSKPVRELLTDAIRSDNITGSAMRNIKAAGDDAMLADAGAASQNLLDTAIQTGGGALSRTQKMVEQRASKALSNITSALDDAFKATDVKRADVGAFYDAAYAKPIDYASPLGRNIEDMIKDRVPANVIKKANNLMRIEGQRSNQIAAKIADDGTVAFEAMPDVRQIDYITRALRQVADEADGKGRMGGVTQEGRAYGSLAKELRDKVKMLVPEYGEALSKAGTEIGKVEAGKLGEKIFRNSLGVRELKDTMNRFGEAEKEVLKTSTREAIDNMMANIKRSISDDNMDAREAVKIVKELSSRNNMQKLSMVVGKKEAMRLLNTISQSAKSLDLRASMAQNSKTFARQNTRDRVNDFIEKGVRDKLKAGEPVQAARLMYQRITGSTPKDDAMRKEDIYREIADVLTRARGEEAQVMLRKIESVIRAVPAGEKREVLKRQLISAGVLVPLVTNQQ